MRRNIRDIAALGAHCTSTRDLLKLAGADDNDALAAEHALSLVGAARDAALRSLKCGPRLLAALELGRRAWMLPSPAGRRVRGPVDVAAIAAPRFTSDEPPAMTIALDRRLTVARLTSGAIEPALVLRDTLGAGVTRVAVSLNKRGQRAAPTTDDTALAERLTAACALVDVKLLDVVLVGDDGFSSLRRLGLLAACGDPRYR